jgi:hypothetical protein
MQVKSALLSWNRILPQVFKSLHHHPNLIVAIDCLLRTLVVLEVLVINNGLHTLNVEGLSELLGRELTLCWASAAKDVNIGDR